MNTQSEINLKLWTMPANYMGEVWPNYYVFLGQHRDSDCLARAKFDASLKAIGGESETVVVVRESHWAVGWVEWIAIHDDNREALAKASEIMARLEDYPVVNEELWSEYESQEAHETWKNCYDSSERVAYIRKHRSQFEFHDFPDMLGCVRGNYFAGYASELIAR